MKVYQGRGQFLLLAIFLTCLPALARADEADQTDGAVTASDSTEHARAPSAWVRTTAWRTTSVATHTTLFGDVLPGRSVSLNWGHPGIVAAINVVPGSVVHRGQPVATLQSDPQTRAAYHEAEAAVTLAASELAHTKDLLEGQLATVSQRDTAQKALSDAQNNLDALRATGAGMVTETLRAPADGVVTEIAMNVGDRPAAGVAVCELALADPIRIMLAASPALHGQVRVGQPVELANLSNPGATSLRATVTQIAGQIDPKSGQLSILVEVFAAHQVGWLPGSRVQGILALSQVSGAVVPRSAVLADAQGAYVYQVAGDIARRVAVEVLAEEGLTDIVRGSLEPGLPIVVLGNYELVDGMAVRQGTP